MVSPLNTSCASIVPLALRMCWECCADSEKGLAQRYLRPPFVGMAAPEPKRGDRSLTSVTNLERVLSSVGRRFEYPTCSWCRPCYMSIPSSEAAPFRMKQRSDQIWRALNPIWTGDSDFQTTSTLVAPGGPPSGSDVGKEEHGGEKTVWRKFIRLGRFHSWHVLRLFDWPACGRTMITSPSTSCPCNSNATALFPASRIHTIILS
jgi:hypothetical protein